MYVRSADLRCKHCLFHINKQMCPRQINSQQWLTVIIRLSVELHCMPKVTSVWYEQTHPSGFPSSKGKWFESLRECHYNHIYLHLFSPSWTLSESSDHSTLWQRVTFPALLKAQLKANGLLGSMESCLCPRQLKENLTDYQQDEIQGMSFLRGKKTSPLLFV